MNWRHGRYQLVWPKDGPKGKGKVGQGGLGRIGDIVTGKGPDIFMQRVKSKSPIRPDVWGNWKGYHDRQSHKREVRNGARNRFFSSRACQRYDPHTRKYVEWWTPEDWSGDGTFGGGTFGNGDGYPRFTLKEGLIMDRIIARGGQVNPMRMGEDWTHDGPHRFQQEHDHFWQAAHRWGENRRQGFPHWWGINPVFRMAQQDATDLPFWIDDEI